MGKKVLSINLLFLLLVSQSWGASDRNWRFDSFSICCSAKMQNNCPRCEKYVEEKVEQIFQVAVFFSFTHNSVSAIIRRALMV